MADISQDRLNQIALRRLANISLLAAVNADGVLGGKMPFAGLQNPVSGAPIVEARFVVVSHDQILFVDPPLAVLAPLAFYDVSGLLQLEERVKDALQRRLLAVRQGSAGLGKLRIPTTLDGMRLTAKATVAAASAQFFLEVDPEGVRVVGLQLASGQQLQVSMGLMQNLQQHAAPIDLELELAQLLPQLLRSSASASAASASSSAAAASSALENVPIAGTPPLAFLLEKFGPHAATAGEIVVDVKDGTEVYRLFATHKEGAVFRVRIFRHSDAQHPLFEDTVDFRRVVRAIDLLATVLGRQVAAPAPPAESVVPDHLAPHVGEVWLMHVLVEREDEEETRYVTTDADGRPYGAARILKRGVFRNVFAEHHGVWRLLIHIEEVRGGQVTYRQLDGARQPNSEPRTIAMAHLVASFVPEATQY